MFYLIIIFLIIGCLVSNDSDQLPEGKWKNNNLPGGTFKTNFNSDFYYSGYIASVKGPEEELPDGTWRGPEEELPDGTWRGPKEEIPDDVIWRGPEEELPDGTWRYKTYRDEIKFQNGNTYKFQFVGTSSGYEIDILSQPGYNGKCSGGHSTHRLQSPRGGHMICWSNRIKSISDAYTVAKQWSQRTEVYRKSGKKF